MSSVALYRAYRPRNFEEVVGQAHVIAALKQAIKTNHIAHAYLFCGTRGTGKTSLAKIMSRAVNCLNLDVATGEPCNRCAICQGSLNGSLLDIIEMDAASNNSVDNIRKITDEVIFAPTTAKYKVYIIDEVHMLSTSAFNALLKTLEEPPAHVIFILATTDPQRIPATILSRCQRYDLHALTVTEIETRLKLIANEKDIKASQDALACIAYLAKGALRDAISMLDQCQVSFQGDFDRNQVLQLIGQSGDETLLKLFNFILAKDLASLMFLIDELVLSGQNISRITNSIIQYMRDLLLAKILRDPAKLLFYPKEHLEALKTQAKCFDIANLQSWLVAFSDLSNRLKISENPRLLLEVQLIKMIEFMAPERIHNVAKPVIEPVVKPVAKKTEVKPVAKNSNENDTKPDSAQPIKSLLKVPLNSAVNPTVSETFEQTASMEPNAISTVQTNVPTVDIQKIDYHSETNGLSQSTPTTAVDLPPETLDSHAETYSTAINPHETSPRPTLRSDLWQETLNYMKTNKLILLFLLFNTIKPEIQAHKLVFKFNDNQREIYDKINTADNKQNLKMALMTVNNNQPVDFEFMTTWDSPSQNPTNNSTSQLFDIAKELNIPIEN